MIKPPRIISSINEFKILRQDWFTKGFKVGFVPTMGALHDGHLDLSNIFSFIKSIHQMKVRHARNQCQVVVVSIFVNPSQFAPTEDLASYPKTLDNDLASMNTLSQKLNVSAVDCVFLPNVDDIYPNGIPLDTSLQVGTFVTVLGKSHQMEGAIRPHFFRGVATVVTKLFNIVQPTFAFFGQKDAQQCSVIKSMVKDLFIPVTIHICPTIRHEDGLAMSSRNRYLSEKERTNGLILFKALNAGLHVYETLKCAGKEPSRNEILQIAQNMIDECDGVELEYLSLVDPQNLNEYESKIDRAIFSGAIRVGKIRLIDNILLGMSVNDWSIQE